MLSAEDVRDLLAKYRELHALRMEREGLEDSGVFSLEGEQGRARRERNRKLAARFPGALREMEHRDSFQLHARIEELERVEGNVDCAPSWVERTVGFHRLAREALAIKAWLAQRRIKRSSQGVDVLKEFLAWYGGLEDASRTSSEVDLSFLQRYIDPPAGRLMELVWEDLCQQYGVPRAQLEYEVLGESRTV